MQTALLNNGSLVHANEYEQDTHGSRIYCIDKNCNAPVIFVPSHEGSTPHFKTTGKNDSKHQKGCGFYEPMDFVDSLEKVSEYQKDLFDKGVKETIIKVNMNRIDPEYETNSTQTENESKDKKESEVKIKDENKPPQSISSVKSVVTLLTSYEPDVISSILVNIGGGRKIPLSDLVLNQVKAHDSLWNGLLNPNSGYFVYGKVKKITNREKVKYINFESIEGITFTLVLFQKYWKHFTYTEAQLLDKDVLVYGNLRKNDYNEKQQTEMLIKSDNYIEFIKRKIKQE
ncbi:hypothetical protein GLW08_21385 [Pontibacillus yanchengensis]|uniref:Uncharacterized protein n=2 Tax=Pontibacillus yanchengensis TaxID=462910 RepID=A0ACC7VLY6_9BACI|nr:hypothetical protein [Pontibacillus yanchengensis]MYL35438.1 hypothetical protein [Pontibacillus yanchengensis]MYL55857.1 hypothetical protein [Pontibacillus yanchengensis]